MDQEWEGLADNFIPPTASRPRTPNRHASTPRQDETERFRETYERRWASLLSCTTTTLTADSGAGASAGTQNGPDFQIFLGLSFASP
jgi:hypothetical protein